ncbi:unnamed protein product [Meloidogyne enterolobii]|uniref:Uncharacterized protein n=1 Tax=Meloidogyne enterolobii TaxID=390850 RepID=A0ACB0ZBD7_MELEN
MFLFKRASQLFPIPCILLIYTEGIKAKFVCIRYTVRCESWRILIYSDILEFTTKYSSFYVGA